MKRVSPAAGSPGFLEFFAGGGMARLGLVPRWRCLFANDICPRKARSYRENFPPAAEFREGDVASLRTSDLPSGASLAWASFPCQDLSLAGRREGIRAERSGAFWPFWNLMTALAAEGRPVPVIVLENVTGLLTSKGGRDFAALASTLREGGYRTGALVMDAALFVPQSRPRLFVIAVRKEVKIPAGLTARELDPAWSYSTMEKARAALAPEDRSAWIHWRLPVPADSPASLDSLLEENPPDAPWNTAARTARLLELMNPAHREKVERCRDGRRVTAGTIYKRTRPVEGGGREQRAEVRFDGVAGCLRTPGGGSSRQTLILAGRGKVRTRLVSAREAARLMGVPETYRAPESHNEAMHLFGDGVAVPCAAWLERHILTPLAGAVRPSPPPQLAARARPPAKGNSHP